MSWLVFRDTPDGSPTSWVSPCVYFHPDMALLSWVWWSRQALGNLCVKLSLVAFQREEQEKMNHDGHCGLFLDTLAGHPTSWVPPGVSISRCWGGQGQGQALVTSHCQFWAILVLDGFSCSFSCHCWSPCSSWYSPGTCSSWCGSLHWQSWVEGQ